MIPDKLIHKDEFRLRVLLTNKCDKNCSFCLNDFQPKEPEMTAQPFDLIDCIRAYGQHMRAINKESIVTFSGGEPGTYPFLSMILPNAAYYCHTVKVVTNGLAFKDWLLPYVHKWHIGVDRKLNLDRFLKYVNRITIQIVVTMDQDPEKMIDLVKHYHDAGFLVKLFTDFRVDDPELEILRGKVTRIAERFEDRICTRFTGVQINRGEACEGCQQKCVTLKALWYFPDGTSSTCPQGMLEKYDDDSWDETIDKAYAAHLYKEIA